MRVLVLQLYLRDPFLFACFYLVSILVNFMGGFFSLDFVNVGFVGGVFLVFVSGF